MPSIGMLHLVVGYAYRNVIDILFQALTKLRNVIPKDIEKEFKLFH